MSPDDAIYNNLYGNIICTKEETNYWMKYGNPNSTYSIVALSSYNGIRACTGCSLYSASKHGIIGLVKSVALEFA
jgi:NAD(P)-dependent dehydrogenase (short-subunit alcohol dehydrogenase family)